LLPNRQAIFGGEWTFFAGNWEDVYGMFFVLWRVSTAICFCEKENVMLARRNDYSHPLETLDREFGRVLNRLWSGAEVPSTLAPYAVDVHEDANHFYVEAELPGFTKEDVDVTLEEGVLTIRGERKVETPKPQEGKQPLHVERRWSRFERSFTLPTQVNEGAVQARLHDGLLTITLDKREEVKPRKIQINVGATPGTPNGNHSGQTSQPKS
jgi:HSP20 family protein